MEGGLAFSNWIKWALESGIMINSSLVLCCSWYVFPKVALSWPCCSLRVCMVPSVYWFEMSSVIVNKGVFIHLSVILYVFGTLWACQCVLRCDCVMYWNETGQVCQLPPPPRIIQRWWLLPGPFYLDVFAVKVDSMTTGEVFYWSTPPVVWIYLSHLGVYNCLFTYACC